jgi:uncharacterized protein (DUF885 family)
MIAVGRRAVLGGIAASAAVAAWPVRAADRDAALRTALDRLAGSYAAQAAQLAGFSAEGLSPVARIDLLTVRRALAIDAELSRLVPGGKTGGPYKLPVSGEPGLWRQPQGGRAYALLLERQLGGRSDPEAAHRRLERELQRLTVRADRLQRGLGQVRGSTGERFRAIFADPAGLYPDSDAGRNAAAADMNRWLVEAQGAVPQLIGPVPRDSAAVTVERMSAAEEAAGKGGYRRLPTGAQGGAYVVDLREIRRRPRWTLKSVVHHELIPGHMIQLPMEAAADPHPLRIAYLPAFAEGWAIHAEQLMAWHGTYRGTPLDELGHVHWLLFRVTRALADTGLHHRRWSLDQARDMILQAQGVPAYFAPFETDLQRIVAEPATRAAEALTWLALADRAAPLRTPAARRAFHQRVLRHGRQPLALLGSAAA